MRELGASALAVVDAMRAQRRAGNPYVFPGASPGGVGGTGVRVLPFARGA